MNNVNIAANKFLWAVACPQLVAQGFELKTKTGFVRLGFDENGLGRIDMDWLRVFRKWPQSQFEKDIRCCKSRLGSC